MKLVSIFDGHVVRLGIQLAKGIPVPSLEPSWRDHECVALVSDMVARIRGGNDARQTADRLVGEAPASAWQSSETVTLEQSFLPSAIA